MPESKPNAFQWKIGGEAGFGIQVSGLLLSKVMARAGLSVFDYPEYPSLIRGGHNTLQVRVGEGQRVRIPERAVDLLVALNRETVDRHRGELSTHGALLYDADQFSLDAQEIARPDVSVYPVPLTTLARANGGSLGLRNTVVLGATLALLDAPLDPLLAVIQDEFGGKGEAVVKADAEAARRGFDHIRTNFDTAKFPHHLAPLERPEPQLVLTGNEAVALGAVAAGIGVYAAYPMTPATSILSLLAGFAPKFGFVVKQTEDELAAVNLCIGAAHAGARAMCGTSGGGFALMSEGYGMAAMTETGIVIYEGMRGGPSTGLPTWTEQADLRFALHAGQGDLPRIVFAPGDVEECYHLTRLAFDCADRYQTPVILLADKHLAESHESVRPFDSPPAIDRGAILSAEAVAKLHASFHRYALTESGVSPRTLPGTPGGVFVANSDEHDEDGLANEEADLRVKMHDKRMRKALLAARELPEPEPVGPSDAPVLLLGYGSTKGAMLEAGEQLASHGVTVRVLHLNRLAPFPVRAVTDAASKARATLVVEGSLTGQFEGLVREQTGVNATAHLRRYDGRPILPSEIATAVTKLTTSHG